MQMGFGREAKYSCICVCRTCINAAVPADQTHGESFCTHMEWDKLHVEAGSSSLQGLCMMRMRRAGCMREAIQCFQINFKL